MDQSQSEIPQNVKSFIAEHIRSVVELEALLLLHRDPAHRWTSAELGRVLCVDTGWAERELSNLVQRGLAVRAENDSTSYHFAVGTPLEATVRELESTYAQRRVSIIQLIFSKPSEPIQSFADAFRFRKDRSDG